MTRKAFLWLAILAMWPAIASHGQSTPLKAAAQEDLTTASIEDLLNMKVTSVSKTEQKLSQTPTAIFVITQEDIRASAALNIPDLLRMVPGVDVAQINSNTWAVTVRGFNGRYSNDVLVLLDGRPVYTQTFAGVYWDVLDLPLEDIDRIEVIRGPGGSVWGSNTDNGVINIISKKAADTPGGLLVAGGGNVDQGFATLQYGGAIGPDIHYRVFSKYFNQADQPNQAGQSDGDTWEILRGGFRVDGNLTKKDTLSTEGDLYAGPETQPAPLLLSVTAPAPEHFDDRMNLTGGYIQSTWSHVFSERSDTTLWASYDHYLRPNELDDRRGTLNVDFRHHILWGRRQDIVWGANYRYSAWASTGSLFVSFNPPKVDDSLFGAFVQDQVALVPDRLYLTLGLKLEHNPYTGFGEMPTVRASWNISSRQMVWGAVTRALRSPAQSDISLRLNFGGFTPPGGTPILFAEFGNPNFQDEDEISYESGYRASFSDRFTVDLALFFNDYTQQETSEPITPFLENTPAPPHLVQGTSYGNLMSGNTYGVELFGEWKVLPRWTIKPGYAYERIHMHLAPASGDTTSVGQAEGSTPENSAQLRSHVSLSSRLGWDASAYFVGHLWDPAIRSYVRLDTGLSWHALERFSLALVGQNLLQDRHLEFIDPFGSTVSSLMERSGYVKATWTF